MLGATGTIGRATVRELARRGHAVTCLVRRQPGRRHLAVSVPTRICDPCDAASVATAVGGGRFDVLVSCLASRTGFPRDAWAIDHRARMSMC